MAADEEVKAGTLPTTMTPAGGEMMYSMNGGGGGGQQRVDYSKLKVAELKELCKARGLKVGRSMDRLVGRWI